MRFHEKSCLYQQCWHQTATQCWIVAIGLGSPDLNMIDIHIGGSMNNAAYINVVDIRQQFWQRMQDTSCWHMCSCPRRAFRAFAILCATRTYSISQSFRNPEVRALHPCTVFFGNFLQHFRAYVHWTFFYSYWHPKAARSFMAHNLQTLCI